MFTFWETIVNNNNNNNKKRKFNWVAIVALHKVSHEAKWKDKEKEKW